MELLVSFIDSLGNHRKAQLLHHFITTDYGYIHYDFQLIFGLEIIYILPFVRLFNNGLKMLSIPF